MLGLDVAQRREYRLGATGKLALPALEHLPHRHALQVFLRPAQRAGNQRKGATAGVAGDVARGDVGERPDDDVATVVGQELRRHRLQPSAEEQVEEQRLDDVIAMVTEGDLGDAVLGGEAVERPTTQPRAQSAERPSLGHDALHDAVGVLLDDVKRYARRGEVLRQHLLGEAGLFLIEIDGQQLEAHGGAPPERDEHVEQRVGILAPRHTHHHAIAVRDHAVVGDRPAHGTTQLGAQTLERAGRLRGVGCHHGGRHSLQAAGEERASRPVRPRRCCSRESRGTLPRRSA